MLTAPGGGRFTYNRDAAGRITKVINPQAVRATWSYDSADRVISIVLGNGIRASYFYDNDDRLTRLVNASSAGTTISSFGYRYDGANNRTRVIEVDSSTVTWRFDTLYQLLQEIRSGPTSYAITYSYDGVGNRVTAISSGARNTYAYDVANQLVTQKAASGTTTHGFDLAGNRVRSTPQSTSPTTWLWDYENRLKGVLLPGGSRNTMLYNGDGTRVQKQDSSGTTIAVWDEENVLLETDQNNVVQVTYTVKPAGYGDLLSELRGSTTSYALFDGLGSTDRLTNSAGAVTDSYVYSGCGLIEAVSGSTVNWLRFCGREGYYYDTDLAQYYVRARYYDPATGRFLSLDPLEFIDGENLYQYVANNPIQSADPTGTLLVKPTREDEWNLNVNCGAGAVQVFWSFWFDSGEGDRLNRAPCEGYFIQKVNVFCQIDKSCCNCPTTFPKRPTFSYYEAFDTPAAASSSSRTLGADMPAWIPQFCGVYKQRSVITFFCERRDDDERGAPGGVGIGNLSFRGSGWKRRQIYGDDCPTTAGGALSTDVRPDWWWRRGIGQPTTRRFQLIWNCCAGANQYISPDVSPAY
jgi:RHS repeat-associated protein